MSSLNGYRWIATQNARKGGLIHYSTGNDETLCPQAIKNPAYLSGDDVRARLDNYAAKYCKNCCAYIDKHGDFQGWDDVNERRYHSKTWPIDAEPVQERVKPRKALPVATQQDTEMHFFGSGALSYSWWHVVGVPDYQPDGYTAMDGWSWMIRIDDPTSQFERITVTLDHARILKAIRQIAGLKLSRDNTDLLRENKYMGDHVIRECRTWVFKGPDSCDFDAGMADSVLQWACIGEVAYG